MQLTDIPTPPPPTPLDHTTDTRDLVAAWFDSHKNNNALNEETRKVYLSMILNFDRYLNERGSTFGTYSSRHIEAFFLAEDIKTQHRYRYIRLLERFGIFLKSRKVIARVDNPASTAAKQKIGHGDKFDPSQFFTTDEWSAITAEIDAPPRVEASSKAPVEPLKHWSNYLEWMDARDKALAAVLLFGGVRVGDVSMMSVNCMTFGDEDTPDLIRIPASAKYPYRESILLPEGRQAILKWISIRKKDAIPGDRMFPTSDKGDPMHKTSIFRRVHQLVTNALSAANLTIPGSRLSPQTLRNTYAAIMFDRRFDDRTIMDSMGIMTLRTIANLRAAYKLSLSARSDKSSP